jgi:hypothetical protein
MFADYAAGKPSRYLRASLSEAGFRTVNGRQFAISTILPMLENQAYVGKCVYNRLTRSKWHRFTGGSSAERYDESIEKRPAADWIVKENAWPALVEQSVFDQVQARRHAVQTGNRHVRGSAVKSGYLLTGMCFCGRCGGKLSGQTTTNSLGVRARYYICATHHNGQLDRCPTRYSVPGEKVERHILDLIRTDLANLRDDDRLHELVAEEVRRLTGDKGQTRERLQRRLAELDQQIATVRGHLKRMDPQTANDMGLYDEAKGYAEERRDIERDLGLASATMPTIPDAAELRRRAIAGLQGLDEVVASGTIEERKELIAGYLHSVVADPDRQIVQINLYPTLFSQIMTGVGLEPTTNGLKGRCSTD